MRDIYMIDQALTQPFLNVSMPYWQVIHFPPQTIGASFFLKQWGPYNVAIWVKLKILTNIDVFSWPAFGCLTMK